MNIIERHQLILQRLKESGKVNVPDLSYELKVSEVTIRKDLKVLEDKKLLFRTHGGAALQNPYASDRSIDEKAAINIREKNRIAEAAAGMISDNDSIILASGTSILSLAKTIQPRNRLTVITSALNVATELARHHQVEVLQLGGTLRHSSSSVVGPYAEQILQDVSCNLLFLGVDGIDLEVGLTTTDLGEARLNQQMIRVSRQVVVLADSSKFGRRGLAKICPLEEVDVIITDRQVPEKIINYLEEKGIKIVLC